jgi:SpoVK/Ycf46/Vps4 family AAA+-type ATPase
MPRTFEVPLPNEQGRLSILTLLLKDEDVEKEARATIPDLARHTVGYSGSDLKELLKAAAMIRIQERTAEFAHQRVMGLSTDQTINISNDKMRPITKFDLIGALSKVKRTGADAKAFGREEAMEQQREAGEAGGMDPNSCETQYPGHPHPQAYLTAAANSDDIPNNATWLKSLPRHTYAFVYGHATVYRSSIVHLLEQGTTSPWSRLLLLDRRTNSSKGTRIYLLYT